MNRKRGAINLPIAVLMSILISLVLFMSGIYFLTSATKTTEKITDAKLQTRITSQNQLQFQQGEKVVLAPLETKLQSGEHFLFTLGVLNTRKQAEEFRFEIEATETLPFAKEQWAVYDTSFFKIPQDSKAAWNFLISVPADTPTAKYSFTATVYDTKGEKYGNPQSFSIIVIGKTEKAKEEKKEKSGAEKEIAKEKSTANDCIKDFSCQAYFIFVPVGAWQSEEFFLKKAQERGNFFQDITEFKFRKTGILTIPFSFAKKCSLQKVDKNDAQDHLLIKQCADRYADSLGIAYEKAIGLSPEFTGGKAFFGQKTIYSSLGFSSGTRTAERPGMVAHELGHGYYLCDEYDFQIYQKQKKLLTHTSCKNEFPSGCTTEQENCLGNTPTYRDYAGEPLKGACQGNIHYSVMGFSTGAECGYDDTGGYNAIK